MKAILFDFDGVLTIDKYGSDSILRYLSEKTSVPVEILQKEYYRINKGLLYGQYTHMDIWDDFCEKIGKRIEYSVLMDSFRNTPLDYEMIGFARELKASYKIGMITDNKVDRIKEILSYHNLEDLFDVVTISAEIKCGKTDREIFVHTLDALSIAPCESVFVDNSPKNLIVPEEMGMKTILFDDEKRDIGEFKKALKGFLQTG